MAIIDELFIKLGYEYDEKDLKKFNSISGTTTKSLKALSLSAVGMATSFSIMFAKISLNALAQKRFGDAMDVSRESIESFSRTSGELTGDRGVASSMIEKFNGIQNAVKAGIAPSDEFLRTISMMGITLEEFQSIAPDEALIRMAEGFQAMDENSKDASTALLGLDSAGRNLLQGLTRERLSENIPSKTDLKSIEEFDLLIRDLTQTFDDARIAFGAPLLKNLIPAIEELKNNLPQIIELASKVTDAFILVGEAIGVSIAFAVVETEKLINTLGNFGSKIGSGVFETQSGIESFIDSAGVTIGGLFGQNQSSTSNNSNTVNQNFSVQISNDNPQAVVDIMQRISEEKMFQAKQNLSNPVLN